MPFEVKKPEMVTRTFRLPADLLKRLEIVAQGKGVSVNNLVAQCCEYALDELTEDHADLTETADSGIITIKELALEIGTTPKALRAWCRNHLGERPGDRWEWSVDDPVLDKIRQAQL